MSLPSDVPTTAIHSDYTATDGSDVEGMVTLTHDGFFASVTDNSIVVPKTFYCPIVNGQFTETIPKSDVTITYKVVEDFSQPLERREYFIDVFPTDTAIELSKRAPVSVVQMGQAYVTQAMLSDYARIWKGTQAEFDALPVKDDAILYVIR